MICSATCVDHSKNSCTLCHQQGRRPFKWHGARGSRLENAVTHLCFVRVIHLQVRPVPYFSSLEMRVWGNTEKALTRIWQGPRCQTKDLSSHPLCKSSRFHIFKINSTLDKLHLLYILVQQLHNCILSQTSTQMLKMYKRIHNRKKHKDKHRNTNGDRGGDKDDQSRRCFATKAQLVLRLFAALTFCTRSKQARLHLESTCSWPPLV